MSKYPKFLVVAGLSLAIIAGVPAFAQSDETVQHLTLKDHKFSPHQITVPSGKKIKLIISNQNGQPAEFESYELHREKVIPDGAEINVFVGPLEPGTYPFFDDLDVDKATGKIIAQ